MKRIEALRRMIAAYVGYGSREYRETLDSSSSWSKQSYLKTFEYRDELDNIIKELEDDGYKVEIQEKEVSHDESAAYMNSGGECGSEEPYSTYDTILRITW